MKWKFVVVGKPALPYAREGMEEYLGRLKHYAEVELVTVKPGRAAEEAERLLRASEGCFRVGLDERGLLFDTAGTLEEVERWEEAGRTIACLIGGAEGLGDFVRSKCDRLIALGKITLQHELALVVLLEQLYRVHSLRRGERYHRGC